MDTYTNMMESTRTTLHDSRYINVHHFLPRPDEPQELFELNEPLELLDEDDQLPDEP